MIKNVRRAITSHPSIFWYYPAHVILRLMTQYHCGFETDAAHQLYMQIVRPYMNTEYADCADMAARFINSDTDLHCMKSQEHILEHACRTFSNQDYRQGVKVTQTNTWDVQPDDSPRTYYFRSSTHQNDANYRQHMINLRGYVFDGSGEGPGVWDIL